MAWRWRLAGASVAVGALALSLALGGGAALAKPKKTADVQDGLTKAVVYAMKHKNSLGHFAGQHLQVTAEFGHLERGSDAAVGKRADHARVFEVILAAQPPAGIFDQYLGCLTPADTDYAKLADATKGDNPPPALDRATFVVTGELESVRVDGHAAHLMLKPGCTVVKAP